MVACRSIATSAALAWGLRRDAAMSVARVLAVTLLAWGCSDPAPDGGGSTTDGASSMTAADGSPTTPSPDDDGDDDDASPSSTSATSEGDASSTGMPDDTSAADTSSPDLGVQEPGMHCTDFPLEENPISEAGAWSAIASPWLRIRTIDGIAKPDAYVTGYNDNYAMLSGFGPDVEITATVYIGGQAPYGEILLLARIEQTETTLRCYEFLYDGDGSVQLMRWNGPSGDFTPMGGETGPSGPLQDFDQLRMRVVGDTITIFHRRPPEEWVQIGETTDATFGDGQPGMGFFVRDEGQTIDDIGLRDYYVEEI
jgi:hypothetical protein